jgi:hypothetical protein
MLPAVGFFLPEECGGIAGAANRNADGHKRETFYKQAGLIDIEVKTDIQ